MRECRRLGARRALLRCALIATAVPAAMVQPAAASLSTITGAGAFTIAVHLELFPCPSSCPNDSFSGTFSGQITGLDINGAPYTVAFPDPTAVPPVPGPNFASTLMTNNDACIPQGQTLPAIAESTGTANIDFVINDGLLTRNGVTSHGASLRGNIFWSRTAADGTLGISAPVVEDVGGGTVATGQLGLGTGVFSVPLSDVLASCANQIPSVTATISGPALSFA